MFSTVIREKEMKIHGVSDPGRYFTHEIEFKYSDASVVKKHFLSQIHIQTLKSLRTEFFIKEIMENHSLSSETQPLYLLIHF